MKIQKSLLVFALFLAFAAPWAGAAPAAVEPPVQAEAVATAPVDLFGASVIDQPAECVTGAKAAGTSRSVELCGPCSSPVCVGQPVVLHVCGFGGGQWLRCHDMGFICQDSSVVCGCNNGIIP